MMWLNCNHWQMDSIFRYDTYLYQLVRKISLCLFSFFKILTRFVNRQKKPIALYMYIVMSAVKVVASDPTLILVQYYWRSFLPFYYDCTMHKLTRSFDIPFIINLNNLLKTQLSSKWFKTPCRSCYITVMMPCRRLSFGPRRSGDRIKRTRVSYLCHCRIRIMGCTVMILGLRPANERRRYFVTTSPIGWAQT